MEENGSNDAGAKAPGGRDNTGHSCNLGMTSVARHSERGFTAEQSIAPVKLMPVLPDRHLRV
ncbi:hypothetical protein BDS110ZK4_22930 [Bradyrhizobium diazoefficiens]|uniref:Uncharacterized protein n=1 Tax=Bradyrhizobium diazoefficiens TaxID=1355477 RepID=A0A810ANX9_9BRAD|nr:hypothetical protein H12S4_54990 [Bradyrhizobium diazoefficiens]BCE22622.1 hypothetical protein XF1B_53030 [Bradyrhizobium diazoefficiens]BCE48887.1 hypothetical protein XF4B_52360 [Bradyrhizobium diazoefficiens]BCE66249.1 hypothetical protein XF6B_50480 [Bradyrhizobium diazoefficiens]BCF01030.1 hypothetical protein XF11B_50500 [Bradyrhizobium diazoefficiens]